MRLLKEESSLEIFVLVILCSAGEFNLLPFAQSHRWTWGLKKPLTLLPASAACATGLTAPALTAAILPTFWTHQDT